MEATVDETAGIGIDVHILQPGMGWVPWWKSQSYPIADHVKFLKERFGLDVSQMDGFSQYVASGGDIVQVFVDRCRKHGITPFVSLRLNDGHGHEFTKMRDNGDEIPTWASMCLSPTHIEHPEWRIGPNLNDWDQRSLNWAIPEVREIKFAYIREIVEQYDIDGFELDFMRHTSFFNLSQTPEDERIAIMADFARRVRELLDRTESPGRHRWLCARIPGLVDVHTRLGIDVRRMADAEVDMFNVTSGNGFFTEHQMDLSDIRDAAPECSFYLEMTHHSRQGDFATSKHTYDSSIQRLTTPQQFYTGAHLAYERGYSGVSTFNFVYYREHGIGLESRGPFTEPPFEVFNQLSEKDWLAQQTQHYILADAWNRPPSVKRQLPRALLSGVCRHSAFHLDMAPPIGGWKQPGRLRIQSPENLTGRKIEAVWNSVDLMPTEDRSGPSDSRWPQLLGTPEQHRAWNVPANIIRDGVNYLDLRLCEGPPVEIVFLDVAIQ